jgi:hypothetical protein
MQGVQKNERTASPSEKHEMTLPLIPDCLTVAHGRVYNSFGSITISSGRGSTQLEWHTAQRSRDAQVPDESTFLSSVCPAAQWLAR